MRVRLTDGTHEVEIKAKGYSRRRLDDTEAAALRMLDALRDRTTSADTTTTRFGFTPDATLDGVSLDSSAERAEPYDDGRDQDDEDEDGRQ
ncbi:hypothetical protein [Streptomyces sp. NBC_01373]|uniref:hypothetical protein n=1 Tax=Streptomyces sp. NBC_01373 TaxID=2903843 RepID=UPI00224E5A18|nr:hypothetical protein [Streptomyces sp. NBC_01373]MCX4705662.1 hypothetical protein [Streptomyces sp. NBC_01373]